MTCSSCKYLKENKKYEGSLCGVKYYCEKIKEYVDGSNYCCNNYAKTYSRSNYDCDKICEEGRNFSDDDRPISYHIIILILIVLLGLLITFLNNISM